MKFFWLTLCLLTFCLSGCQSTSKIFSSQKYTRSTQGIKTSDLPLSQIKIGMSKEAVVELLGPPHINPSNPDTWVYLYLVNGKVKDQIFYVVFAKGKVISTRVADPNAPKSSKKSTQVTF